MTKKEIVQVFTRQLEEEIAALTAAAQATYDEATHEESKPENKYDTRGLEASYLAGAQAKRVVEIREILGLFKNLNFKDFTPTDPVGATALVEVTIDGKRNTLLLLPKGGGFSLRSEGQNIQIISLTSFLGEAIVGLRAGDEAEYEIGPRSHICKILSIK